MANPITLVTQTAITQTVKQSASAAGLPVAVSHTAPIPALTSPNHVLVRVLAVALNPTDYKMPKHFPMPLATMGCDFCGIVVESSSMEQKQLARYAPGTRVCGAVYGYNPEEAHNGAFAEYVVADERLVLRVPESWSDLQAAALGGIGWGTCGLALWDGSALALEGRPSQPVVIIDEKKRPPVLVYGGATATGTMACQLLKLAGYAPIATASAMSKQLTLDYGAEASVLYKASDCAAQVQTAAAILNTSGTIKHALDCITDPESAATCFSSLSRTGGRYACLEAFNEAWRTRRAVRVETVLGYEMWGARVQLGPDESVYSRPANDDKLQATVAWAREIQGLLDRGLIKHHPFKEVEGKWCGIIKGLEMLQTGNVRGQKLVVKLV